MPGRNDWSSGFTKSAQKNKYIRHRDVKLKDSEVRKEANISKAMCDGVCDRCREKAQWRFKYDKYKPLKAPGNCQQCKQKVIIKAYRTLCDPCAAAKKSCPGCCVNLEEASRKRAEAIAAGAIPGKVEEGGDDDQEEGADDEVDEVGSAGIGKESSADAVENEAGEEGQEEEDDEDEGEEEEEEEDEMEGDEEQDGGSAPADAAAMETVFEMALATELAGLEATAANIKVSEVTWNQRKFTNVAANKYSKSRVVGKEGI